MTIPDTLQSLRSSSEFALVVNDLRSLGWKDWHILLGIKNVAMNYWLERSGPSIATVLGPGATSKKLEDLLKQQQWDTKVPVPASEFSRENLDFQIGLVMAGSELRRIGLELYGPDIDVSAVREFLTRRTAYWNVDVEHEEIFPHEAGGPVSA